jgi:hypothetical protein
MLREAVAAARDVKDRGDKCSASIMRYILKDWKILIPERQLPVPSRKFFKDPVGRSRGILERQAQSLHNVVGKWAT